MRTVSISLLSGVIVFAAALMPAYAELDVTVDIKGAPDATIQNLAEESLSLTREEEPVGDQIALERLTAIDRETLRTILRSFGFYAADVKSNFEIKAEDAQVTFFLSPGPAFMLADIEFIYPGNADERLPHDIEDFGLHAGMIAKAEPLKAIAGKITTKLRALGYPDPKIISQQFVSDREMELLRGEIQIDTGPLTRLGELEIQGLKRVSEPYLRRLIQWQPGGLYSPDRLNAVRRELSGTGLFRSVVVDLHPKGPKGGHEDGVSTPVLVQLEERKRRALSAGVGFSTDAGVSISGAWRHRNVLGEGEEVIVDADLSTIKQELSLDFRNPNFKKKGQTLDFVTGLIHEDDDAYEELSFEQSLFLSWPVNDALRFSAGPTFALTEIDDGTTSEFFGLLGLSGSARYDVSDDLLDPTRGSRITFSTEPAVSVVGEQVAFWVNDLSASTYFDIAGDGAFVLATRGRIGSIVGAQRDNIPANRRLYAGGGGSVRGFGFRDVGPVDAQGDPVGGRSVLETSVELRWRFYEDFGLVPFLDGGQVFESIFPDFEGEYRWAAGLGFRYYSPIGPVRLDLGFPLNGRDSDDSFQLYVSVGQAF